MIDQKKIKISLPLILIIICLMVSFVLVQFKVFNIFETDNKVAKVNIVDDDLHLGKLEDIKAAKAMYASLKLENNLPYFIDESVKKRTLKYFYSLRAYSGAPPRMPHPINNSKTLTGDSCLACHRKGGFTPKYNAYAPVVPHPEKLNCRQCHNPTIDKSLFKKIAWKKNLGIRGHAHLPNSPLVIPHSIQMRENCLACHSGPAAIVEIRTTHPERLNCMQCHVEKMAVKVWER